MGLARNSLEAKDSGKPHHLEAFDPLCRQLPITFSTGNSFLVTSYIHWRLVTVARAGGVAVNVDTHCQQPGDCDIFFSGSRQTLFKAKQYELGV